MIGRKALPMPLILSEGPDLRGYRFPLGFPLASGRPAGGQTARLPRRFSSFPATPACIFVRCAGREPLSRFCSRPLRSGRAPPQPPADETHRTRPYSGLPGNVSSQFRRPFSALTSVAHYCAPECQLSSGLVALAPRGFRGREGQRAWRSRVWHPERVPDALHGTCPGQVPRDAQKTPATDAHPLCGRLRPAGHADPPAPGRPPHRPGGGRRTQGREEPVQVLSPHGAGEVSTSPSASCRAMRTMCATRDPRHRTRARSGHGTAACAAPAGRSP